MNKTDLSLMTDEELRVLCAQLLAQRDHLLSALREARGRRPQTVSYSEAPIRRDGRPGWYARTYRYVIEDGKTRTLSGWCALKTEDEAEARRRLRALHRQAGRVDPRRVVSAVTLSALVDEYCKARQAKAGTAPETLRRYREVATWIQRYAVNGTPLGDRLIDRYGREELEAALLADGTLRGGTATWTTRRYRVAAAKALWRYALQRGYVAVDVAAAISCEGTDPQSLPEELPIEAVRQLVSAALEDKEEPWLADSIVLLGTTCLRPLELWRLSWRDVELSGTEGSRLRLSGTVRRKNGTPSLFPLAPEAVEILTRWQARARLAVAPEALAEAPVLWEGYDAAGTPARLTTAMVGRAFSRLVRQVGVRCRMGEIPTLYSLRHFYQQLFEAKATTDVRMKLMGHSTPDIGPQHYMSAMEEAQRTITADFPRLASG